MEKKLEVRAMSAIYLNGVPLVPDLFDYVFEIDGFKVAYNSSKLMIVDSEGNILLSEEGLIAQDAGNGKCIALRKGNLMGVYHYDGTLLVPFEFYLVSICNPDKLIFKVQKNKGDAWELYNTKKS